MSHAQCSRLFELRLVHFHELKHYIFKLSLAKPCLSQIYYYSANINTIIMVSYQ